MPNQDVDPVISRVMSERDQDHDTRKEIFVELEQALKRPVLSFFTSFTFPVGLEDTDVDTLAGILQMVDLSNGLALVISSPGGDGLAAERMINVCRSYSGTGDYWAIVPGKAKSAATMVCLGASKVFMGPTSELGPVEPQIAMPQGDTVKWFSAHNIVQSYRELFREAVDTEGNLEPYLQQLQNYDAREIRECEIALDLSVDIAVRALKSGMMRSLPEDEIEQKMQMFLTPESKKTHGRPIYRDEAGDCGLNVEAVDAKSELWRLIYELYIRTNNFVSTKVTKCIESKGHSFIASTGR